MYRILSLSLMGMLTVSTALAQKSKPWTEWSKKDAEKILNDSAWAKTQDDTDITEMMYAPTSNNQSTSAVTQTASNGNSSRDLTNRGRQESGAKNSAISLKYRVRFFSAKPVREAFARALALQQSSAGASEQQVKAFSDKMQSWVDADLGDIIVVAVSIESTDRRISGPIEQAFRSATSDTLKNKCYLERSDGNRIYLSLYEQPTADQTGAKFVFPRSVDGKPFLSPEATVRFVAEFSDKIKINRTFKVAEMTYNGKLEY